MALKIETIVAKFVEIREKRAVLKRAYEAEDFKLKEVATKIEIHLLKQLQDQGVDSFKTSEGTAYTALEMKASCADWPGFWEFCAEHRRFDMLEKRVSIGAIRQYLEENSELPPYVNTTTEKVVRVRRS